MTTTAPRIAALLLVASFFGGVSAFLPAPTVARPVNVALHGEGTGGWGLGNSRDMVPEEFAKGGRDRRQFEGYHLTDRGEFMRQVRNDADAMKEDELSELLGVAGIAGINVKDPKERLNKFDQVVVEEENDDLDVSI